MSPDENLFIEKARGGNVDAFSALAEAYERRIYTLALHYTRAPHDAEDLAQEVWLKAFKGLKSFRGEASFYSWLWQIMVNTFLNHRRGKQSGACAGPLIWFHMPEQGGRYIFSVMPHPSYDFKKIGVIENNRIKFTMNGDYYEWISNTPIVGNGGNWNLYVIYDNSYVPDPFLLGVNNTAKVEPRDSPSNLTSLERSARQARAAKSSSFDKSSASRKEETLSPARLIIGASDRPENLLPK